MTSRTSLFSRVFARSYTNHTNHFDQWHTDITLEGTGGSSYLIPTSLDSARMFTARQVYGWTAYC